MKKLNKKHLIFFLILLILPISFLFTKDNNFITNIINKQEKNDPIDEDEPELDNWELSMVFYDSSVDGGTTPLTEINWEASDGSYKKGETRVITVQINYKNTNTVTDYEPGELEIKFKNFANRFFNNDTYNKTNMYLSQVVVGANDPTHVNYDWNFKPQQLSPDPDGSTICSGYYSAPESCLEYFYFTNANRIEKKSNLEGSIQIEFTLYPQAEQPENHRDEEDNFLKLDECEKEAHRDTYAELNNTIRSNTLYFNYHRLLKHPWDRALYDIVKTAEKITSYDGLGEDAEDYTWVKYNFRIKQLTRSSTLNNRYPYLGVNIFEIRDMFPDDVVVKDSNFETVEPLQDGYHHFYKNWNEKMYYSYTDSEINVVTVFVGYPKNIYNEENNNTAITNEVKLYGKYSGETEDSYLEEDSISIDLSEFEFQYPGELYKIIKVIAEKTGAKKNINERGPEQLGKLYYETLHGDDVNLGSKGKISNLLKMNVVYTGQTMDVKFGDDVLFVTTEDGGYRKVEDDEYYFTNIAFPYTIKNGNNSIINGKYNIELWVRHENETNYVKYDEFTEYYSPYGTKGWHFTSEDKIVGYYFLIRDLKESVYTSYERSNTYSSLNSPASVIQFRQLDNIAHEGKVYNFLNLQVLVNGELINSPTVESYENLDDQINIAEYDMDTYGSYIQRDFDFIEYSELEMPAAQNTLTTEKTMSAFTQDAEKEKFYGTATVGIKSGPNTLGKDITKYEAVTYYDRVDKDSLSDGYETYDLLPLGMKLESSAEDIIESAGTGINKDGFRIIDSNGKDYTKEEWIEYVKTKTTVTITENYNNTGRTKIAVVFDTSDNPILVYRNSDADYAKLNIITYKYNYSVSYDAYLEYGKTYTNRAYTKFHNHLVDDQYFRDEFYKYYDNGQLDIQEADIDDNGNTSERILKWSTEATITSVISTNQDVQTSVQSDLSNYDTGRINTPKDSEYIYKLRVRTGNNDVTNLVIYDSLEEYAKNPNLEIVKASGGKQQWQGELLGVDTSYAESKGYTVKVYYNENSLPGTLAEDDTWQEYTDSTDKSKVKAFAFEYLNEDGSTPAVLPANSLTYVLIRMKSPNKDYITYAYNGCWTEWNAIDPITERPVDFITGINSNIVKVALPRSIDVDDVEKTLVKKWVDGNNSLNLRPENVTFQLITDGDTSNAVDVLITGDSNEWTTNIAVPEYDMLGREYEYSITESPITLNGIYKYKAVIDNLTITNTLYKDITLTKVWKDNTDAYLTRPSNVTFKVKQNGNDYQTVTFGGNLTDNEWTKVITVPVYDTEGNEYTYTIEEVSVDNYSTSCENFTCTNTLTDNDTIKVKKIWVDSNNDYSTRPQSIDIKLKQNGNNYQTVTLTGDTNTWESDNITVPKYDENGVKYTYLIEETQLDEYGLVEYNQSEYTVTNTLKKNITITVTKNWLDNSNALNLRPDELKINLLRNNSQYQELNLTGTGNTWTTSITVPKYDDNNHLYAYSIKELTDNLNEDYSNITYSEQELTVTNKLEKSISIKISKIWDDGDNELLTRPESLNINLLRNGNLYKELELIPTDINDNTWELNIEDLDAYDLNGALYNYTIEENLIDQLNRYETITYDQTNYTITNKLTIPPKVTLFFTVKNGYLNPGSDEIQYDEEGLNNVMGMHNLNGEEEYVFNFELENVDTGEIIKGVLSTQGTLEFDDVPYGTYRAREGEDKYFDFVSMVEIEAVLGVSFTPDSRGGTITISPTGQDIIYGAQLTNKIEYAVDNPNTKSNNIIVYFIAIAILSLIALGYLKYNPILKYKR